MVNIKLRIKHNDKWKFATILFVSFSLILIMIILIGGFFGRIYIKKYFFTEDIKKTINRENVKFTLYGYCIDQSCSNGLSYNFNSGISLKKIFKKSIHIIL